MVGSLSLHRNRTPLPISAAVDQAFSGLFELQTNSSQIEFRETDELDLAEQLPADFLPKLLQLLKDSEFHTVPLRQQAIEFDFASLSDKDLTDLKIEHVEAYARLFLDQMRLSEPEQLQNQKASKSLGVSISADNTIDLNTASGFMIKVSFSLIKDGKKVPLSITFDVGIISRMNRSEPEGTANFTTYGVQNLPSMNITAWYKENRLATSTGPIETWKQLQDLYKDLVVARRKAQSGASASH